MRKNLTLFIWFIKFGIITARDEYDVHDCIRYRFCPEYIPVEEFDEKEQLLRDSPGPAGIKYAYYVGSRVSGIFGAAAAIIALLIPVAAVSVILFYAYGYLFDTKISSALEESLGTAKGQPMSVSVVNGIHASTLGLIAAHLYKTVYFNRTKKHTWLIVFPAAFIFMFLPDIIHVDGGVLMPYYIAAVVVLGVLFGFIHHRIETYRANHPSKKYIDPHSRKAIKIRDRQILEEEEELKKSSYDNDEKLRARREQIEEEEKKRKHKSDE